MSLGDPSDMASTALKHLQLSDRNYQQRRGTRPERG
jgi:hypothetical protein